VEQQQPPRPPPKRIKISEVTKHIRCKYNVDGVTRQTVYNWIKTGVQGTKLKITQVGNRKFTTKEWVDDFLTHLQSVRPL
jgi:hypothetical protein